MALQPRAPAPGPPSPYLFATSQAFEGNDGPWSTFVIRVGTPEQIFHVLISTNGQETWVPVPEGCLETDPSNCGELRGVLPFRNQRSNGFQVNSSSTWEPESLFELGVGADKNYTGNGQYGFDTVGLQLPQSGGLSLKHQIVAGIATKDFYLGQFGLGPKATNFTDFDTPDPSFLWSMKNQSLIPSLSWAYTAGAKHRLKGVPASLVFGGYDASRYTPNSMNFTFNTDDSKLLTVGIQTIQASNTLQGVMSMLPSGILALVDSTFPEIWLPTSACQIFETSFGLTYDPDTDRYLVNSTIRERLLNLKPVVSFKLGNKAEGGDTTVINLPYAAFDLKLEYPIYPNSTYYFPLRRATLESQYTLGRTFLSESYLIANYERSNFSISQALFPENTPEQIVPILPPITKVPQSGLSRGALIGIIVAGVVLFMLLATGLFIFLRIRQKKHRKLENEKKVEAERQAQVAAMTEDKHASGRSELMSQEMTRGKFLSGASELMSEDMRHEMATLESPVELPGSPVWGDGRFTAVSPLGGNVSPMRSQSPITAGSPIHRGAVSPVL